MASPNSIQPSEFTIILGASRGLGAAVVEELARREERMVLISRTQGPNVMGGHIQTKVGDLNSLSFRRELKSWIEDQPGRLKNAVFIFANQACGDFSKLKS